jgi:hypothetical protein
MERIIRKVGELFYLDLNKIELQGWEDGKSDLVVAVMIEGIKLGHDFPAVEVVQVDDFYQLRKSFGGGHHRAVAHYIQGVPLKCQVFRDHFREGGGDFFPISETAIWSYVSGWHQFDESLLKLPEEIGRGFCKKNNLVYPLDK